jgi:hypothetical protein
MILTPDQTVQRMVKEMESTLAQLAMHWRGCDSDDEAAQIAIRYQLILQTMIQLGFRESLQFDSELPDELMPQEYFDLFKQP